MKKILIYIVLFLSLFLLTAPIWANEKLEICNKYINKCKLKKNDVTATMSTQDYFEYMNQCESKLVNVANIDDVESKSYIIYGECKKPKFVELLSVAEIHTKFETFAAVVFGIVIIFLISAALGSLFI